MDLYQILFDSLVNEALGSDRKEEKRPRVSSPTESCFYTHMNGRCEPPAQRARLPTHPHPRRKEPILTEEGWSCRSICCEDPAMLRKESRKWMHEESARL